MLQRAALPARDRLHPAALRALAGGATAPAPLVARLQSSAGNRAVAQLMASGAPIGHAGGAGNRALAAALAVQRAGPGAGAAKPDTKAERKAWEEAGLVGGGALYDLVNKDLSIAKLVGLALPELAGLINKGAEAGFEAATEAGGTKGKVEEIGLETKEVGQVSEAVTGWAQKAAEKWLATPDGKAFLAKAQAVVNEHPTAAYWTIVGAVAAGIAGATIAYFSNAIDPPELKKQFELAGIRIDAAVDLGKVQEQVLQSARLALKRKVGPGEASLSGGVKAVKGKEEEGYEYSLGAGYTLGPASLTGGYGYSSLKDQSSFNLGVGYKFQPLTLESTFRLADDGTGTLDTTGVLKLGEQAALGFGTYGAVTGPGTEKSPLGFKLSLTTSKGKESDKITADINPTTRALTLGREQVRSIYGGMLTVGTSEGDKGTTISAGYKRDALSADLKYSVSADGAETLETGAKGKAEGAEAGISLKYGLSEGELQALTTHLAFTTPDETLKFLNDIAITLGEKGVDAKVSLGMKLRLKSIAAELAGSMTVKEDVDVGASAKAAVGWKLPAGITMGVGAGGTYTPDKGKPATPWMVGPELSVGHEALPIRLVGGVNVPVGPGSEGLPPVFGLSIAPAFEFLGGGSGKKKK